jgi:hypothetical protein
MSAILIALLIGIGLLLLAIGGLYLGRAYATDVIARRTELTKKGSYIAAAGVALFALGFAWFAFYFIVEIGVIGSHLGI